MTDNKESVKAKILSGGLKLGSSQVANQACGFARNVILARLITTADFGIASIFALTFYLLEMLSNLALEALLVQADDGDEPRLQATAQFIQATRGIINAIVIFIVAKPVAHLFSVPQAWWAFACMALVPLLKGFTHLDPSRVQRVMRFGPWILTNLIPTLVVVVLTYPLGAWLKNYAAMLWLLIVQMALSVVISHLLAERHYAWAWDRVYARRIFEFGWPLLINGLLMYLIFQGDRFVIGAAHQLFARSNFTLSDLGVYSVAFTLTMAPSLLVGSVGNSLFLPLLSRARHDRPQFDRRYIMSAQIIALAAAVISIPFIVAGGPLVVFVYGKKYAAAASFIGWLGGMQFLRMLRAAPTQAAMALGDTANAMYSNIARTFAFLGILSVAATGGSLTSIATCGFFGEVLALIVCLRRLQLRRSIPAAISLKPASAPLVGVLVAGVVAYLGAQELYWPLAILAAASIVGSVVLVMLIMFPDLRNGIRTVVYRSEQSVTT